MQAEPQAHALAVQGAQGNALIGQSAPPGKKQAEGAAVLRECRDGIS
jgi:hypothetical protein